MPGPQDIANAISLPQNFPPVRWKDEVSDTPTALVKNYYRPALDWPDGFDNTGLPAPGNARSTIWPNLLPTNVGMPAVTLAMFVIILFRQCLRAMVYTVKNATR